MLGRVIKAAFGVYSVYCDGMVYSLFSRGKLKYNNQEVVVGDLVDFDEELGRINELKERKNTLKRPKIANLDKLFIVISLKEPVFSPYLLFKFITYARSCEIVPTIIFSKCDGFDLAKLSEYTNLLSELGIAYYFFSKFDTSTIDNLRAMMKEGINALMGQTGVGKSTILNALDSSYKRRVGEYSKALGRGKHQTKEVILLPLENGAFIADSPGFSSLDLDLSSEELFQFFPLIAKYYGKCFYNNCSHTHENKCQVKKDITLGKIPQKLYDIYVEIYNSL